MYKTNITPYNEKHQPHGYWISYYFNGSVWYEGNYINGKEDGIWLWYWDEDGKESDKEYYIN